MMGKNMRYLFIYLLSKIWPKEGKHLPNSVSFLSFLFWQMNVKSSDHYALWFY